MKSTETVQPSAPASTDAMSPADLRAHDLASYARRPAVSLTPLLAVAVRRALAVDGDERYWVRLAAERYLDFLALPVGDRRRWNTGDAMHRDDAWVMEGEYLAKHLGITVRRRSTDLEAIARAVLTAYDVPVTRLERAAVESGNPGAVAFAHLVGGR
jgi:hypothetical protein